MAGRPRRVLANYDDIQWDESGAEDLDVTFDDSRWVGDDNAGDYVHAGKKYGL